MEVPKGMWKCKKCGSFNYTSLSTCSTCHSPKMETDSLVNETITSSYENSQESFWDEMHRESSFSTASGLDLPYVVLQVTLKEKFIGTGSGNLTELEDAINAQVRKGYRLHTITTANGGSKGMLGGDRIQATMVFEKLDIVEAVQKAMTK